MIDWSRSGQLPVSRFPDLMNQLGVYYSEEWHGKYATQLAGFSGVLKKNDFVSWYVSWLIDDNSLEDEGGVAPTNPLPVYESKFWNVKGAWRCQGCWSMNLQATAPSCISCDAANPKCFDLCTASSRDSTLSKGTPLPIKCPPFNQPKWKSESSPAESPFKDQIMSIIVSMDTTIKRINKSAAQIETKDEARIGEFETSLKAFVDTVHELDKQTSVMGASRDKYQKNAADMVDSVGVVHKDLEYVLEFIDRSSDKKLEQLIDERPLGNKIRQTRDLLKAKLDEVTKLYTHLESCLDSMDQPAKFIQMPLSEVLVNLKQTYTACKRQYKRICELSDRVDMVILPRDSSLEPQAPIDVTVDALDAAESQSKLVRNHFLSLCNKTIAPRDVFTWAQPKPPAKSKTVFDDHHRVRLIAFFQQHNRFKLRSVDTILTKYKGREEQLFELLDIKYVRMPQARAKLVAFYQQYNPFKLGSVDTILAKYKGREERLFELLNLKYVKNPQSHSPVDYGTPPQFGYSPSVAFGAASCAQTQACSTSTGGSGFGAFSSSNLSFRASSQSLQNFQQHLDTFAKTS